MNCYVILHAKGTLCVKRETTTCDFMTFLNMECNAVNEYFT